MHPETTKQNKLQNATQTKGVHFIQMIFSNKSSLYTVYEFSLFFVEMNNKTK